MSDDALSDGNVPAPSRGLLGRLTGWGVNRVAGDSARADSHAAARSPRTAAGRSRGRHAAGDDEGVLAVYSLGKSYGGRAVVKDVSIYGAPRRSGRPARPQRRGKTTVFYMITGLVRPDKGVDRTRRL